MINSVHAILRFIKRVKYTMGNTSMRDVMGRGWSSMNLMYIISNKQGTTFQRRLLKDRADLQTKNISYFRNARVSVS